MATTASPRVLVVDDEPVVRDVLTRYLAHEGFEVDAAADGHAALRAIEGWSPHVVLLDLMLPKLSGLEVLRLVRLESSVPVIILSAKVSERDRIAGLELGADDYVVKPYSPGEVVARVRAVLRRAGPDGRARLEFDELAIDPLRREVTRAGEVVHTTRKEFELLHLLASHPGRVFTRSELVESVWGYVWSGDTETVTVHVRRLRAKIEPDPSSPRRLITVHGVGYRFEP
jgi:two-component system, OmpR family, phosphate regulon response regulator PhoB